MDGCAGRPYEPYVTGAVPASEGSAVDRSAIGGFDVAMLSAVVARIGAHYGVALEPEFHYYEWCNQESCSGKRAVSGMR